MKTMPKSSKVAATTTDAEECGALTNPAARGVSTIMVKKTTITKFGVHDLIFPCFSFLD